MKKKIRDLDTAGVRPPLSGHKACNASWDFTQFIFVDPIPDVYPDVRALIADRDGFAGAIAPFPWWSSQCERVSWQSCGRGGSNEASVGSPVDQAWPRSRSHRVLAYRKSTGFSRMLKRFLMLDGCQQLCKWGKICWKAERHGVFACIHALLSWIIDLSRVCGTQRWCCYYPSFARVGKWCSFSGSSLSDSVQDIWWHGDILRYFHSHPIKCHQTCNMLAERSSTESTKLDWRLARPPSALRWAEVWCHAKITEENGKDHVCWERHV